MVEKIWIRKFKFQIIRIRIMEIFYILSVEKQYFIGWAVRIFWQTINTKQNNAEFINHHYQQLYFIM